MGQGPFATRKAPPSSNRRRSTRVDFETPVILSGRDAAGQTYRDATVTETVNIHGAKVYTERKVLVGMLVTIECLKTGRSSKGVCVNTYQPSAEQPKAAIAVQLLQPGNIWGVENPPNDWATVAAAMGGGPPSVESSWSGVGQPKVPTIPVAAAAPVSSPAQTKPPVPPLADQAQVVVESALKQLRVQSDTVARSVLAAYEQRLAERVTEAEARLTQGVVEQAAAELAATVQALKGNAMAEMVQTSMEELKRRFEGVTREHDALLAQRIAQLTTEAAERLEAKTADVANSRTTAFEQHLEGLARQAEVDLATRVSEACQGFETVLSTFRSGFADDLAAQQERAIQEADQAVRARLAALVSSIMFPPQAVPAHPDAALKK